MRTIPRGRFLRAALAFATAFGVLGLVPATVAGASVTCSLGGATAQVTLSASGDTATIVVDGTVIEVNNGPCGDVLSVDTIAVNDTSSSGNTAVTIDLSGGPFAPGATLEGDTSSEIELDVGLGSGSGDALAIVGSGLADQITAGDGGINLNAAELDGIDADVTTSGVEQLSIDGGAGNDTVSGAGGAGTGNPFRSSMTISGGGDDDQLTGGDGQPADLSVAQAVAGDTLDGGPGADSLNGGGGNDLLIGGSEDDAIMGGSGADRYDAGTVGTGADSFDGGPGFDVADYSARTENLRVSLDNVANDGSAIGEGDNVFDTVEEIDGGLANDVLTGSAIANTLVGNDGKDTLNGGLGDDTLDAGSGNDGDFAGGGDDRLMGGPGNDNENGSGSDDVFEQQPYTIYRPGDVARNTDETAQVIPDKPDITTCATPSLTSQITIPAAQSGQVRDINLRMDVEMPPAQVNQLNIILRTPTSTFRNQPVGLTMISDPPRQSTPFRGTTFDSEAFHRIGERTPRPYDGRFHPEGSFDITLRGVSSAGTWELRLCDDTRDGIQGVLNWWTLEIAYPYANDDGSDIINAGGPTGGQHDLLDYAARANGITADMSDNLNCDGQVGECDKIGTDMEDMYGGLANDTLTGNDSPNDLRGHQGNDVLNGLGGADKFRGGLGNDTIDAGDGDDLNINGNDGDDTMDGGAGNDKGDGGSGIDHCPNIETRKGCEFTA